MDKNPFFVDASEPSSDIAAMLLHLNSLGVLPEDMKKALRQHASNAVSTIPQNIASLSRVLAGASSSGWVGQREVTDAAYGLAELADLLRGFQLLLEEI